MNILVEIDCRIYSLCIMKKSIFHFFHAHLKCQITHLLAFAGPVAANADASVFVIERERDGWRRWEKGEWITYFALYYLLLLHLLALTF